MGTPARKAPMAANRTQCLYLSEQGIEIADIFSALRAHHKPTFGAKSPTRNAPPQNWLLLVVQRGASVEVDALDAKALSASAHFASQISPGLILRGGMFHLEMPTKLLKLLQLNLDAFSKYALKSLNDQADFDSAIRRFDPSRPSQQLSC
jgi:hypothetical protein